MEKIIAPERMIRTTLGEFLARSDFAGMGIYVLACYPSLECLYIGISNNVLTRIRQHLEADKPLGQFIKDTMADACGYRLDILVAPDGDYEWCRQAEKALIQYFRPTFNQQHLGEPR
jgi:hypothetical protein